MHLSGGKSAEDLRQISEFSKWVLDVGNGELPTIEPDDTISDLQVSIPEKFLIKSSGVAVKDIVDVVYPDFLNNMSDATYLRQRSILAPTNAVVGDINDYILVLIPRDSHTYYSQDSLAEDFCTGNDFQSAFPVEYINLINMPCLPRHDLKLKVGSVVMLMRNLNQIMGLCNGTRMIVKKCLKNNIICQILCGSQAGSLHIIPRIEMMPTDTKWPFDFKRVQFSVQLCFAMTINKSQGQSMDNVSLYLPTPVFTHGQLYVVVSRVTYVVGLHILLYGDDGNSTYLTANVVYEKVFYNLPSVCG